MPDVFDKAKRSAVMSRIRGRGNRSTEVALASLLRHHRITGWRRGQKLLGKPDFVFVAARLAVFVDGCFWHGCPLHCTVPKSNSQFWSNKLKANRTRDRSVCRRLRQRGWFVIRIWECELSRDPHRCVEKLRQALSRYSPLGLRAAEVEGRK